MATDLRAILALSTIIPTLIFSVSTALTGKERASSRWLLATLYLIVTVLSISTVLLSNWGYMKYFPLAHILNLFILLLGPLFYLYVKSTLDPAFIFRKRYWLFFAPMAVVFILFLYKTLCYDVFYGKHNNQFLYKAIETVQNAFFFFTLVPLEIQKRRITAREYLLNFRNQRLTWLRFLHCTFIIIWLNKLYLLFAWDIFNNANFYLSGISLYSITVACFLSIALFLFMNRDSYLPVSVKYRLSNLDEASKNQYFSQITDAMEKDQAFLDPDLTLSSLADKTKIPAKAISQIINERAQLHFNEFVNRYRVMNVCRMLDASKPDGITILQCMYDSGFNSKSTFNDAFRKITGMTPLEYRRREKK
jgi:AraC-like DNA-binding protein